MKINLEKKLRKIVNGNTEGFSTIELIIALVIAGISMGVALPRLTNVSEVDVYSTAKQVQSDIRYTQELAMSKYRQTTITFAADSNTYTITSSGPTLNKELPPRSRATFDGSSTLSFTFNSFGEPASGGTLTITTSAGFDRDIVVSSITGKANIL